MSKMSNKTGSWYVVVCEQIHKYAADQQILTLMQFMFVVVISKAHQ